VGKNVPKDAVINLFVWQRLFANTNRGGRSGSAQDEQGKDEDGGQFFHFKSPELDGQLLFANTNRGSRGGSAQDEQGEDEDGGQFFHFKSPFY